MPRCGGDWHWRRDMGAMLTITRTDHTAAGLRSLSARCTDGAQVHRMLALALVLGVIGRATRQRSMAWTGRRNRRRPNCASWPSASDARICGRKWRAAGRWRCTRAPSELGLTRGRSQGRCVRSTEPSGTLAKRYGVSAETIRKWRKRGPADSLDHSARPHRLPWKATEEERAVVCALRRATNFALDDLTFVVCHFLPHLNRDSVWRILKAEGLNRRTPPPSDRPARGQGRFRDYDLGFIHIDIKHLPKLQAANGEPRKRYLYVAIDRRSRSVHLAVKDDETERSAIAFLREAAAAFPFRFTHVLTDNGSCFTPGFARACAALGAEYRHTKPRSPQTNGMVERFNGRVGSEVLAITVYCHRDLEQLLRGFNAAYNAPPSARAGRQDPRSDRRRATQGQTQVRPRQASGPGKSRRCRESSPHRRSRQGGLTARQLVRVRTQAGQTFVATGPASPASST
jgi:transposase